MTSISPCLWFDDNLMEAMAFYTRIFPDSRVTNVARYTEAGPGEPGAVMAGEWVLDGMVFRGINGGPAHAGFTETVSFSVSCADQSEVDYYWENLVAGGEESMCGWLRDRFGLSWQIVPTRLHELLADPEPARAAAAAQAMLGMTKIVVAELEEAAARA